MRSNQRRRAVVVLVAQEHREGDNELLLVLLDDLEDCVGFCHVGVWAPHEGRDAVLEAEGHAGVSVERGGKEEGRHA